MDTQRLLIAFCIATTLGCSSSISPNGGGLIPSPQPSSSSSAVTTPMPQLSGSKDNVSGYWYASEERPASGAISSCDIYVRYALRLEQTGNEIRGSVYQFASTEVTRVFDREESIQGTNDNGEVQLQGRFGSSSSSGANVNYVMRFDEANSYLVGTRNGRALWLQPIRIENCPQGSTSH